MSTRRSKNKIKRYGVHVGLWSFIFILVTVWIFSGNPQLLDLSYNNKSIQLPPIVHTVSATSVGPNTLGTSNSNPTGWTAGTVTVANLNTDNNANYAICTACSTTNYAKLTNFIFSIPSTGTITAITVTYNGKSSGSNATARSASAILTKDGSTAVGGSKTMAFATSDGNVASTADLWSTTWTPAEVNASTFGVFAADLNSTAGDLQFDYVTITIAYNTPYDASWVTGAADFKIYLSSVTTWDAGTLICSGTLTDDNTSTISCSSSAIAASTQYRVQVRLKNAGEVTATMDGASEYIDHKNVKAGWAGTSPTLGACVFNDAGADDVATATCSVAFNVNDVRITETGTGSVKIAAAGNEGYAYLITTDSAGLTKINSTSYYDTSIDSVAEDSSKITITGPNILPTGTFNSAVEKTDGTGKVDISINVADTDGDLSKAKVEYQSGSVCSGTWSAATLATPVTATYSDTGGVPSITATAYQVGNTATTQIKTASGTNTVTFVWNSATDVPTANGTYCLRLTANDGTADQATPATQTLTIDNVAPTAPGVLTDGGKTKNTVTLTFGSQTVDTNFSQYKIFYKAGASGVTVNDTQHSDSDLAFINYNGTTNTTVSGLSNNTQYVFNIWAYDTFGYKTPAGGGSTSSGPNNYSIFADDNTVGTVAWQNPTNATTHDSSFATVLLSPGNFSHYLKVSQAGFNVSGTINGIKVEVEQKSTGGVIDDSGGVYIVKNGAIGATSQANAATWPTAAAYATYGGASNLWGETWTAADINSSSFGFVISAFSDSVANQTGSIDHIRITVYYTTGELTVTTLANSAPTGSYNSAVEKTDGTGVVDISTEINDTNVDTTKARVEYIAGSGCSGSFSKATIQTPITAECGSTPNVNNTPYYQVGKTTPIATTCSNTVDFDWASATDVPAANGTYCLRLYVNDGSSASATSTAATRTLTVDNVAPTAPGNLTDGGKTSTSITLNFGSQTTETNFTQYKIYYKAGTTGVAETDTQWVDTDLGFINYNSTTNTVVTGLSSNTAYVFNIWAYDAYGKKASATEVSITTSAGATVNFTMQTGYYMGNDIDNTQITAPGWSPDLVMIYDDTVSGATGPLFKTSVMSGETTAHLGDPTADIVTDAIQSLDATGFTVGTHTDTNLANKVFKWFAFDGSTCNSNGTFCVGTYTGNGNAGGQAITSVGFQPDLVIVKGTGATDANWRSSTMAAGTSVFFGLTAYDTASTYLKTLDATGFTVGSNNATVNANGTTYYYIAFKQITGKMKVGTYTGNGVDNTSIAGVGFKPELLFIRAASIVFTYYTMMSSRENRGDFTNWPCDCTSGANHIQALEADGFQLGTGTHVNSANEPYHYFAFAGSPADPTPSGTFTMATGSYVGNKTTTSISGIGFAPDLVIVKHSTQATPLQAIFKTSLNGGTESFYFNGLIITLKVSGINSIDSSGFTIGGHETVNADGDTYYWEAFGNAFSPKNPSGAADFAIGAYTGVSGVATTDITRIGMAPDFVMIKNLATVNTAVFRTSSHSGDLTSYFYTTADTSNLIKQFNSDGFQIGSNAAVNNATSIFVAFKTGTNFKIGTYTGNGTTQAITGLGFKPDLVWAKTTGQNAVFRPAPLTGDSSQFFLNVSNAADEIKSLDGDGFTVGAAAHVNTNVVPYYYMAWNSSTIRYGDLYSSSIDTDSYPSIYNKNALRMVWNQNVPSGCRLELYIRSTNTGPTPDYASSTWQGPYTSPTGIGRQNLTGIAALQSKRFFQYRVDMYSCALNTKLPTLYDVQVDFD